MPGALASWYRPRMRAFALLVLLLPATALARQFHVEHRYSLPAHAGELAFLPLPSDDPWQRITGLRVEGASFQIVHDPKVGNAAARVSVPADGAQVMVSYDVERSERAADLSRASNQPSPSGYVEWLKPDQLVPVNERVLKMAAEVTRGKKTPLARARAIYDYVLSTMKYDKSGSGWGRGDLIFACDHKYGNCTDFHSLLIGLLRASGIPARFQIGYSIPTSASGELPGYHCWADFYLDGVGWVPVDASEAWKHPEQREYFFGHHDANRVALSTGRDLSFPGQASPPLNYFVYPLAEANGQVLEVARSSRFESR